MLTPRNITIALLIAGFGLLVVSWTMPYYSDQAAFDALVNRSTPISRAAYYAQEAQLSTHKRLFMDIGAGVMIVAVAVGGFLRAKRIHDFLDFRCIRTVNKVDVFLLANGAWLLMIPGTIWLYTFKMARGDFPAFADTIGIPITAQIPGLLLLSIPLNLFLWITTINNRLPAYLFMRAELYTGGAIAWEIFFGLLFGINLLALVSFIADGDHVGVAVSCCFIYVLLTLRAGQLTRFNKQPLQKALSLIEILEIVKGHMGDDSDMLWTPYETAREVRDELDQCIASLKTEEVHCLETMYMHFLPTSTFQEHSLMNGWANEYIRLAERFDTLYASLKKYGRRLSPPCG